MILFTKVLHRKERHRAGGRRLRFSGRGGGRPEGYRQVSDQR